MDFQKIREFLLVLVNDLLDRLKPERIQDRTMPAETPMTHERIVNRALASGFELLYAPVAIRRRYRRASFAEAVDFVHGTVAQTATDLGHSPKVVIDGGTVVVTLGIEIPNLLSEADFDVADALKAAAGGSQPDDGARTEPVSGGED